MQQLPRPLQILSQIYLYVFIVFFIYVVLSVFIGLITVTYETLIVSVLALHIYNWCSYCINFLILWCVHKK